MTKTAVITGITGQDGSYLAENLLNKGYGVIGLYRRSSSNNLTRLTHLLQNFNLKLQEFDLTDPSDCVNIISSYKPNEFYNLAAQSHVGTSFKQPTTTFEINTVGVINLLENIRKFSPTTRFYQASTSEMFGRNYITNIDGYKYQDENTPFMPQSPYAVAKLSSHRMVQIYREAYGLYACSGILFNHESPRRGENFVTRKITRYIGQLVNNLLPSNTPLKLGNIEAVRDWGHAKDYVEAMRLMLTQGKPDDFVISTGQCHSVKDFLTIAFKLVNLNYTDHIMIDPELYRPAEVQYLNGDSSKAQQTLLWKPTISFEQLVEDMVTQDIKLYNNAKL
jgi:GDPmannose 4,6-dehydratase